MPEMFAETPSLIAMIHVGALPGTPHAEFRVADIIDDAVNEARLLSAAGVNAILIENMHDRPYLNRVVGPESVACMSAVLSAIREEVGSRLPLGVQILAGANRQALASAFLGGGNFVRAEGFVFAHVADEGLMPDADAGALLRYRRSLGAERISIYADVKKKHSAHAITQDVDLAATARAAEFFGADGIVVTGGETGLETSVEDVCLVKENVRVPVLVGSGITPAQLPSLAGHADGLIVGSYFKREGRWFNPPDAERLEEIVTAVRAIRAGPASKGRPTEFS